MTMKQYEIYCDGGARGNPGPAAGAFVVYHNKELIYKSSFYLGETTNNIAEYSAVLKAWQWIKDNSEKSLLINFFLDSELVVKQLNNLYRVKNQNLKKYFDDIKILENTISAPAKYHHIYRHHNSLADKLLNKVLDQHENFTLGGNKKNSVT